MVKKNKKPLKHYTCPWCRNEFWQGVAKVTGVNGGTRAAVSDQVQCNKCFNFMETW